MTSYTSFRFGPNEFRVRRVRYYVPSDRDPAVVYTVEVDPSTRLANSCTCPDHTYRHRVCKHMRAAEHGRAGRPTYNMMVRDVRRPAPTGPCALCGNKATAKITSAGYMGTATDALVCADWRECGGDQRF